MSVLKIYFTVLKPVPVLHTPVTQPQCKYSVVYTRIYHIVQAKQNLCMQSPNGEEILHNGEGILHNGEEILHNGEGILHNGEGILHNGKGILHNGE